MKQERELISMVEQHNNPKYCLFCEYVDELECIRGKRLSSLRDRPLWFQELCDNGDWIDIYDEGKVCGFLIVYQTREWAEHDFFICQAYVAPKSRRKGLMSETVMQYTAEHPGIYGLIILERNTYAQKFWKGLFEEKLNMELIGVHKSPDHELEEDERLYIYK